MAQKKRRVPSDSYEAGPAAEVREKRIAFDYLKGNFFCVISVNGILGGLTPNGDIHMAVWSQRIPYPRRVVHAITENVEIGEEIERDQRPAIVREIEAGLVFNPEMARAMIRWLEKQLDDLSREDEGGHGKNFSSKQAVSGGDDETGRSD